MLGLLNPERGASRVRSRAGAILEQSFGRIASRVRILAAWGDRMSKTVLLEPSELATAVIRLDTDCRMCIY
jgi:hypothetical protein